MHRNPSQHDANTILAFGTQRSPQLAHHLRLKKQRKNNTFQRKIPIQHCHTRTAQIQIYKGKKKKEGEP